MRILVTGSAGHLGEALVRTLGGLGREVVSADLLASPFTTHVGDLADRGFAKQCMAGVDAVIHSATLRTPARMARRTSICTGESTPKTSLLGRVFKGRSLKP